LNLLPKGSSKPTQRPAPIFLTTERRQGGWIRSRRFLLRPDKSRSPNNVCRRRHGGPSDSYIPATSLTLASNLKMGCLRITIILISETSLASKIPDTRITNVNSLPPVVPADNELLFLYNDYRQARCTASIRCGSNWIAARNMPPGKILRMHARFSPGSNDRGGGEQRRRAASNFSTEYSHREYHGEGPRPWASTTSSRAMFLFQNLAIITR